MAIISSSVLSGKQIAQHIVHDPIQFLGLLADPIGVDPSIKVLFLHKQLAFYAMMREWMCPIHQTIPKPADGTTGVGCERLQIEILWLIQNCLHVNGGCPSAGKGLSWTSEETGRLRRVSIVSLWILHECPHSFPSEALEQGVMVRPIMEIGRHAPGTHEQPCLLPKIHLLPSGVVIHHVTEDRPSITACSCDGSH